MSDKKKDVSLHSIIYISGFWPSVLKGLFAVPTFQLLLRVTF